MPLPLFLSLHLLLPLPLCHQIYFGAGVFSSVYSAVILPNTISVGASGALMGIMGAWVVHLLTHWAQARGARGWPCGPGALSPRPALRRAACRRLRASRAAAPPPLAAHLFRFRTVR